MAWYRCGGGLNLDLTNPDVVNQSNISGNSSKNITVTQLPRFVVFVGINSSTAGRFILDVYDVKQNKYLEEKYSSQYYNSTGTGYPDNITAVTASTVTVKNSTSSTYRSTTLIYY